MTTGIERMHAPEDSGRVASAQFVGRAAEFRLLQAGLADALRGSGGLVLLVGEPGIGKTRLAHELSNHASAEGALVLWGRCWEGGGAPAYWPWVQILRSYLRQTDTETLREQLGSGATLVAQIAPDVRDTLDDLPAVPSLDPDQLRFAVFDATSAFLRGASRSAPLLLVLDDLHAADRSSLLLLDFLARDLRESRIFVVGTYRDVRATLEPAVEALFGALAREGDHIPLRGLAEEEIRSLIEAAAGRAPDRMLARAVHRTSEGNPFFVCELVRLLTAEGRLTDTLAPGERLGIPHGVREAVTQRLAMLPEDTRAVLAVASVIGRDFELPVLRAVLGRPRDELIAAIGQAVDAQLVTESLRALGRYSFAHALVREVLYDQPRAGRRAALHRAVAEALEDLFATTADAHLAELAHHYFQAAALGSAEKALEYSERAGDRARDTLAHAEAAGHYERALRCMELARVHDDRRRCNLLLALAETRLRAGDTAAAVDTFQQAADLARRLGATESLARAALGRARGVGGYLQRVRTERETVVLLEEALARLSEEDSALRARILARLAAELYFTDQVERRLALSRAAIEMARRLGDAGAILVALYSRHWAAAGPETLAERLRNASEMIGRARELGDREMTFLGHHALVECLLEVGDVDGADRELEAMAELAGRLNQPFYSWRIGCLRAGRAVIDARFEDAERIAYDAFAVGGGDDDEIVAVIYRIAQTFAIRYGQGRLGELEHDIVDFTRRYPWVQPFRLPLLHAELRRRDEARAELERQGAHHFADFQPDRLWLARVSCLAHACSFVGDAARASQLYELLLPYAERNVSTTADQAYGPVATRLGMLATVMGRFEAAERHFVAAQELCERMRAPAFAARNLCEHARMLLARRQRGDDARVRQLLARARRVCEEQAIGGVLAHVLELEADRVAAADCVFRREGDVWTIVYQGHAIQLRDGKGPRYLRELLRQPGAAQHVLDIVAAVAVAGPAEERRAAGDDVGAIELRVDRGDGATAALDAAAKAAYRERLEDLERELAEARAFNDPERVANLERERDAVAHELRAAVGLGGRDRKLSSQSERARVNVTRTLRITIERIGESSPALGQHLSAAIRTGTYCSYAPDPDFAPSWQL